MSGTITSSEISLSASPLTSTVLPTDTLISVATSETNTTQKFLTPDTPLDMGTETGSKNLTLSDSMADENQLQSGTYLTVLGGVVVEVGAAGTLPEDVILNGGVYMAGATVLPAGLSVDLTTGVILTDGTTYYSNTINNVGVLCAAAE